MQDLDRLSCSENSVQGKQRERKVQPEFSHRVLQTQVVLVNGCERSQAHAMQPLRRKLLRPRGVFLDSRDGVTAGLGRMGRRRGIVKMKESAQPLGITVVDGGSGTVDCSAELGILVVDKSPFHAI
jgi:hypothetical protein